MRTNKTMKRLTVVAAVLMAPAAALAHGAGGHAGHAHGHFHHANSSNMNANGRNAIDRDTGHARAADRMSQNGLKHNNAGITAGDNRKGSH